MYLIFSCISMSNLPFTNNFIKQLYIFVNLINLLMIILSHLPHWPFFKATANNLVHCTLIEQNATSVMAVYCKNYHFSILIFANIVINFYFDIMQNKIILSTFKIINYACILHSIFLTILSYGTFKFNFYIFIIGWSMESLFLQQNILRKIDYIDFVQLSVFWLAPEMKARLVQEIINFLQSQMNMNVIC